MYADFYYPRDNGILSVMSSSIQHAKAILSVMSSSIQHAKALRRVGLEKRINYDGDSQLFFNALFSIPRQQLANLTLDISELPLGDQDESQSRAIEEEDSTTKDIIRAWQENAKGQKIRRIKCRFEYKRFRDMATELNY